MNNISIIPGEQHAVVSLRVALSTRCSRNNLSIDQALKHMLDSAISKGEVVDYDYHQDDIYLVSVQGAPVAGELFEQQPSRSLARMSMSQLQDIVVHLVQFNRHHPDADSLSAQVLLNILLFEMQQHHIDGFKTEGSIGPMSVKSDFPTHQLASLLVRLDQAAAIINEQDWPAISQRINASIYSHQEDFPEFHGASRIQQERRRQICEEGYAVTNDDELIQSELLSAAICYAAPHGSLDIDVEQVFPFDETEYKPVVQPVGNLVKAGALIAAEIDRLQRTLPHNELALIDGAVLIEEERMRQVRCEGYSFEHDDTLNYCELVDAALCYCALQCSILRIDLQSSFPFMASAWKPSTDPVKNLVKAGALICAEIDRLLRASTS